MISRKKSMNSAGCCCFVNTRGLRALLFSMRLFDLLKKERPFQIDQSVVWKQNQIFAGKKHGNKVHRKQVNGYKTRRHACAVLTKVHTRSDKTVLCAKILNCAQWAFLKMKFVGLFVNFLVFFLTCLFFKSTF